MKPWYRSKTIRLNAAAAALAVVELNFHLLQTSISPAVYVTAAGILAALNVLLRAVTTTGISVRGGGNAE
jgi:hypothetical protein